MADAPSTSSPATRLATIAKLLESHAEILEKFEAIHNEMAALVQGQPGIGAKLKRIEEGFDAAWGDRYAAGQPGRYVWNRVVDRAQMKRLLRAMEVDELLARAARYIRSDDEFFVRARHGFGLFVRSVNQWAQASATVQAAPVGCQHQPACRSDVEHTSKRRYEMGGGFRG